MRERTLFMTKDQRPNAAADNEAGGAALWTALRLVQGGGATQQLGTHVSKEVYDLLKDVAAATGIKQRALLEYAITQTYGTTEGRKLWQGK